MIHCFTFTFKNIKILVTGRKFDFNHRKFLSFFFFNSQLFKMRLTSKKTSFFHRSDVKMLYFTVLILFKHFFIVFVVFFYSWIIITCKKMQKSNQNLNRLLYSHSLHSSYFIQNDFKCVFVCANLHDVIIFTSMSKF